MAAKKKDMFQADEPEKAGRFRSRTEERVVDLNDEAERRAERLRHEPDEKVERKLKNSGSWAVWFSFLLAATWLGGVGAFLVGYYTPEQLIALPAPIALGGGLMIFGGAIMILFMGFLVRETAQTRTMSRRLAAAADVLLTPARSAKPPRKNWAARSARNWPFSTRR